MNFNSKGLRFSAILVAVSLAATILHASDEHDHDHSFGRAKTGSESSRPDKGGVEGACLTASALADVANRESKNLLGVARFLTDPDCQATASQVTAQSFGLIKFREEPDFPLKRYAPLWSSGSEDSQNYVSKTLAEQVPNWWRMSPPSQPDTASVIAQLAVLSPPAARWGVGQLVTEELRGKTSSSVSSDSVPVSRLKELGLGTSAMANEVARAVEEMALSIQADSLANVFRGLAASAIKEPKFVAAYNLSAEALNRGVQRALSSYTEKDKKLMTVAAFEAADVSSVGTELMEPGAYEVNSALGKLLNGGPWKKSPLKKFWHRTLNLLLNTKTQPLLATAFAESLTPQWVFLAEKDRKALYGIGFHYPDIARRMQEHFIEAWNEHWSLLQKGHLKVARFNEDKSTFFEPAIESLLQLPIESLHHGWVNFVWQRRLLSDKMIEDRFPLLTFQLARAQGPWIWNHLEETDFVKWWDNFQKGSYQQWALTQVYMPGLVEWVMRQSKREPATTDE